MNALQLSAKRAVQHCKALLHAKAAWIQTSFATAAGLLIMAAVAPLCHADKVTLHEAALVKGPSVLLRELAEIDSAMADILGEIKVTSAAQPGSSKRVNAALVEARIRHAGVDTENFEITGARRIEATTLSQELSRAYIASSLEDFILNQMPWPAEDTEVDIPLPLNEVILPDGEIAIEWRVNPQYDYVGSGSFKGTILVDNKVQKSLLCKAIVEPYTEVVVAARDISRGRLISAQDLILQKRKMNQLNSATLTSLKGAIGQAARKTIFPGEVLTTRSVEPQKIYRRNDIVPIEFKQGTVFLQARAQVMGDARIGDMVVCRNLISKERFQGYVRKDGVIVVE